MLPRKKKNINGFSLCKTKIEILHFKFIFLQEFFNVLFVFVVCHLYHITPYTYIHADFIYLLHYCKYHSLRLAEIDHSRFYVYGRHPELALESILNVLFCRGNVHDLVRFVPIRLLCALGDMQSSRFSRRAQLVSNWSAPEIKTKILLLHWIWEQ